MDIETVVRRAADNDAEAWRELVMAYGRLLRAVCAHVGLNRWDAEDAVQEAWLALWEGIGTLRRPEQVRAWLCQVTRRQCLRIVARRRVERPAEDPDSVPGVGGLLLGAAPQAVDAALLHDELATVLWLVVGDLPDRERSVVRALFDREERSYREVAEHLAMPIGAIGPVRMRALERLPDALTDAGVTVDDLHAVA